MYKAGEVVFEGGDHVLAPVSSRTWTPWPRDSDFRIKDRRSRLWNLPQSLKKLSEARHVSGVSMNGELVKGHCLKL